MTITVLNPGRRCYLKFGSNSDSSDFILKDSTKIPSAEKYVGNYDRQYTDFLEPPQKSL